MHNNKTIVQRKIDQHCMFSDSVHPLLARICSARDVASADELEYSLDKLLPFSGLKNIEAAIDILCHALEQRQHILIVADFDADGATSCALVVRALRLLGAHQVSYLVPNRFEYGYGLTPEIVDDASKLEPHLIITVDNGISSHEGVKHAREYGIDVLVTDHHLPADTLPNANTIVNPNQPGDEFASKNMAGVGVIFYVMLALRTALRERQWFEQQGIQEPNLATLLDLVALGTVADVVPLDYNNRLMVSQGLARIRAGHCCAGIRALLDIAQRSPHRLVASDLGFAVAPRLNAAGRLEDMGLGIECLLTDDAVAARQMAGKLDQLNRERREIESQMQAEAMKSLSQMKLDESDKLPTGLCLYDPGWHQGVIGILASRIKDKLHRPVIAFAHADDDTIKGSARSVPGVHIRDVLDAVAAHHPGLLSKFGGHAAAAGMTLRLSDLDAFKQAFNAEVECHLQPEDLRGVIVSDGELSASELNLEVAELLRGAGPWGQGFPEPVFDGVFELVNRRVVGDKHLKMMLRHPQQSQGMDAIAFNTIDTDWPPGLTHVEVAYRLDVNDFRGTRSAQLIVEHVRPV